MSFIDYLLTNNKLYIVNVMAVCKDQNMCI